ncbi:MAG TPA: hypothetical protein VMT52_13635 [Planctomycetota bacterium]|nr:hypothetical protein [Planctomycetota bacterium]
MLLTSFATVLFMLSVWKLLSFFIMPSLFFDLLFIGFPLGALVGVKAFRTSMGSFRTTIWILQGAMAASVLASLACKHFDYLRAHLFEVEIRGLVVQMGTFTLFFLPFFCAYGLSEYVGYQLGMQRLRGRMRFVYAIYLFGAAFAYLFLDGSLRRIGITGVIGLSFLLVAAASLLLARRSAGRAVLGLECALLALALAIPDARAGLEERFLAIYKGKGFQSTRELAEEEGYRLVFQRWGKYSLTEIMYSPSLGQYAGFYNDLAQWHYARRAGFTERMLGAVPINHAARGGRIAIIGAGGGRQVKWALEPRFSFEKILAIELEPAVIDAVEGPLSEEFGGVYDRRPGSPVEVHRGEARGFMEATSERFDLIFMPSVGGYPQMMLEPGNMIRTSDAYELLRDRLTDRGVLAIWYPVGLDRLGILTDQYVRTLGEQGLEMKTRAYANAAEYLILAAKRPETPLPECEEIDAFLQGPEDPSGLPPVADPDFAARNYFVGPDPAFRPITDEQPFLAGNVSQIFSLRQLYKLFSIVASFLLGVGVLLLVGLRRRGDPGIPGRSYVSVAGISLLIGANFIAFEHYVILALFQKLYVFHDALTIGAISFLVVSGLGSVLITPRARGPVQVGAAVLLLAVLFWGDELSPSALLALLAPVAFATGSFFPAVFELASRNPLAVFAMDAVGAALGSMIAFFIPIAFGFSVFFPVATALFLATSLLTWRFCRGLAATRP